MPDNARPPMSVPAAITAPAGLLHLGALGVKGVLLVWDLAPAGRVERLHLLVDGRPPGPPSVIVQVPRTDGGMRLFAAFGRPAKPCDVTVADAANLPHALVRYEAAALAPAMHPSLEAERLSLGLSPEGADRVVGFLLNFCGGRFSIDQDAGFAKLCWGVLGRSSARAAQARLALSGRHKLYAAPEFGDVGRILSILLVEPDRIQRLPVMPKRIVSGNDSAMWLAAPAGDEPAFAVVLGAEGQGTLSLTSPERVPNLIDVLGGKGGLAAEVRSYAVAALRGFDDDAQAQAGLRELHLMRPLPKAALRAPALPVSGEVEVAVSHGAGGVFLAGWLKDPYGLVDGMEIVTPFGARLPFDAPLHRFARPEPAAETQRAGIGGSLRSGFVGFMPGEPGPVPLYQCRVDLVLTSGARLSLVGPVQPAEPALAKAAVLGSVPPGELSPEMLDECIAPPTAALHALHMAGRPAPKVHRFGAPPSDPAVSIIVPLYRNLSFLRFQAAAFAADAAAACAELIFVLDSPEQEPEVRHLLKGLHLLYGLPMCLAVQEANFGYSPANNTGAALATAGTLLFLNSDVVPDRPGWLPALLAALREWPEAGAVGPKLLFEDDSIQHAGLLFGMGPQGWWINQHYHKGYPRDYAPANLARPVPGITGACLLVRRDAFDAVGGFTEDYVVGDYEDSDFCLKLRAAGHDIRYVPSVELYHLERRSIQQHAGYTQSAACEYNCWLHHRRWDNYIALLMAAEADGQPFPARPQLDPVAVQPVLDAAE